MTEDPRVLVEALAREVGRMGLLLHAIGAKEWALPTRCPPMRVIELVAHLLRGPQRLLEKIDQKLDGPPGIDAPEYFRRASTDGTAELVLHRALEAAADKKPRGMLKEWDRAWVGALQTARRELAGGDPVGPWPYGPMLLSEYIRTRLVEVVVHHADFREALGRPADPESGAVEGAAGVLREMLGRDVRPLGIDDLRFLLVGTGRVPMDARERNLLGHLADRFPLLT